ncbi:hypothetical protein GCM10007205_05960 [Oxalicibacterium flavum]|uniref:Uncharacterized protein n=1 Tax=Oxalicibacterium flavum TaxID=179467 RepID=A0A8J2UK49_9BURK|nr:hypothetical protein [Oxalicibacterium flavum]GGB99442.1 hypothetical protein GCM10007205_05960 [Oxalicibacterium flavum]
MFGESIEALLQQKRVRLGLGILCIFFAVTGAHQLLTGSETADLLRGGGNLLAWGGFAVRNLTKAYGREQGGLNIPINVGIVMIIAGWFF